MIERIENTVAQKYASDVMEGRIKVSKLTKRTVERHLEDLKNAQDKGWIFSHKAGEHPVKFIEGFCKHGKGEFFGLPFQLSPFQVFKLYVLFGWLKEDGYRRFNTAYNEVARKNGKTTEGAGIGLYLMVGDGEKGADIYSAATKREQAKICFEEAKRMVRQSPALRQHISILKDNINYPSSWSKFEPLSSDSKTLDGLNVHGAIVDELHAHKTSEVVNLLDTARGARTQSLIYEITTAGYNRESICWRHRDYTEKVLTGAITDESWFGMIFTLDEDDDWQNAASWIKANPNLGISKKMEYMHQQAKKAMDMPSFQNDFKRLDLNVWTTSESRWMDQDKWAICKLEYTESDLIGRECYAGFDLARSVDITALVLIFPDKDGTLEGTKILPYFWIPEDNIHDRYMRDQVPYHQFKSLGLLRTTPGDVTDYDFIRRDIVQELSQKFIIKSIAFDRWNATQLTINLQDDGIPMSPYAQSFGHMNPPIRELERLIMGRKIHHNGNRVMDWMFSNVTTRQDPSGNVKFDKEKSREKIDGMVALAMAVGEWLTDNADNKNWEPLITQIKW